MTRTPIEMLVEVCNVSEAQFGGPRYIHTNRDHPLHPANELMREIYDVLRVATKKRGCPVSLRDALLSDFMPFSKSDYQMFSGIEDPNAKIADGKNCSIILSSVEPDDGGPTVTRLSVIGDKDEEEWYWDLSNEPKDRFEEAEEESEPSKQEPEEIPDQGCGHYAFSEELDGHYSKCTEDEAERYANEGNLTVVVSKTTNGDYKVEADSWYSGNDRCELIVTAGNVHEPLLMFMGAYQKHCAVRNKAM